MIAKYKHSAITFKRFIKAKQAQPECPVWSKAFPYQREGVIFGETALDSYPAVMIADEMGLGKTVQALLIIRRNALKYSPTLFVVPSSITYNWAKEYMQWILGPEIDLKNQKNIVYLPVVKLDGQTPLLPGFKFYFISQDLLSKPAIQASIAACGIKLAVIDECHKFKNDKSKRTVALRKILTEIPKKILLSGTPIMNRFTEYTVPLMILDPDFWTPRTIDEFTEYGPKNKVLGIKKYKLNEFFDRTSKYIIRREAKNVLKDLPPMRKEYRIITDIGKNAKLVEGYNRILDKIDEELHTRQANGGGHMYILALLQQLRHLTGLMKIGAASDFIEEFTLSKEQDEKLAIGCHHHDVEDYFVQIIKQLYDIDAIHSNGKDDALAKMHKEQLFRSASKRFAVLGIIAWGEGRNLQFCQNFLVVEREWNPAIEEQFEKRFQRPLKCNKDNSVLRKVCEGLYECPTCGDLHKQEHVMGTYLIAKDTIDEFFHDLNEMKRAIKHQVMDRSWSLENDSDSIRQLAQRAVNSRMKFVG